MPPDTRQRRADSAAVASRDNSERKESRRATYAFAPRPRQQDQNDSQELEQHRAQQIAAASSTKDDRRSTRSNSATDARVSSYAASSVPTTSRRSQQQFVQHRSSRPVAELVPPVRVSDATLVERVQRAASSIDWRALREASASWSVKKRTGVVVGGGEFTVATHRQADGLHVMATGSLTCSVAEMAHILWTTRSERFLVAMTELHGPHFVSGAVVHKIDSYATLAQSADTTPTVVSATSSRSDFDVTVKTATFAKAHLFARDEQWCYVDQFMMQPDRSRFLLTMQSLHPDDVVGSSATVSSSSSSSTTAHGESSSCGARNSLHGAVAGYSVIADPRGDFVWVAFYARCRGATSRSATKSRLVKLAASLCNLPAIVQRRRLGAQVFASPKALVKPPNNTHCKCCTVALTLLVSKKRCHLCGYRVCTKCSTKQQIERAHRRNSQMVRVCAKCARRVNAANYDDLSSGVASPVAVTPGTVGVVATPPLGKALAAYLRQSLESATDDVPRTRALLQVAQRLLDDDDDAWAKQRQRTASVSPHRSVATGDSAGTNENELLEALERSLFVAPPALNDCRLAHADDTRTYALDYALDDDDGVGQVGGDMRAARYPLPDDELARTDFVRRLGDLTDIPELEIICALASQELQCAAGLVTLVAGDSVHIVASNSRAYHGVVVPRGDSICSHIPMSDKPLLVPHPTADVRFCRMAAVRNNGVRFYFGFPLLTDDGVVFGSVCCVDTETHHVTQSQYAIMAKLAAITSRILKTRRASWATAP